MMVAGIDAGTVNLEASVPGGVIGRDDAVTGINRLLELLVDQDVGKAVCESTGGDQRQLDLPLASPLP